LTFAEAFLAMENPAFPGLDFPFSWGVRFFLTKLTYYEELADIAAQCCPCRRDSTAVHFEQAATLTPEHALFLFKLMMPGFRA